MLQGKEKFLQEKELLRENESLRKQVIELKAEVMKGNESRGKMEAELSEYQEKCDGFYNQVVTLNAKVLESEKKADNLAAQVVKKEDMIARMRDQVCLSKSKISMINRPCP